MTEEKSLNEQDLDNHLKTDSSLNNYFSDYANQ